ncbi:MAG: U32 family peptidase [Marinilabiliaceae bacterium]|nr:U32 family peptidase [Marinilabiliaceae bacterium]
MIRREDIEIMAPVGSYESLTAAIQGGADAVYLGIGTLNMRARSANNFDEADLQKIVEIAHSNGKKVYLTVNTIVYDNEFEAVRKTIDAAKQTGVEAIIASDIAAIMYARSIGVDVHISTQCNISNIEAVKFYSQFSDVVVLARELNINQVKYIHDQIVAQNICGPSGNLVRIEMFAHGALCMAVSGKCYLSLNNLGRSANRGACLQVCRRSYLVKDAQTGLELEVDGKYIMSPKDLKTIDFLDKLIEAGVSVLKIEGRARSADYVKTVCSCYDEAVRAIADGTYVEKGVGFWDDRLTRVFNRGFWDGYYQGQTMGEWTDRYGNLATVKRVAIGTVRNYFSKIGVGEFVLESDVLNKGDEVVVIGATTGVVEFTASELRTDKDPLEKVTKGDIFSMPIPSRIRRGDKLYKIVDSSKVNDGQR